MTFDPIAVATAQHDKAVATLPRVMVGTAIIDAVRAHALKVRPHRHCRAGHYRECTNCLRQKAWDARVRVVIDHRWSLAEYLTRAEKVALTKISPLVETLFGPGAEFYTPASNHSNRMPERRRNR